MNWTKLAHAFIVDVSNIALLVTVAVALFIINPQLAYLATGLFVIRTTAKLLLAIEQQKEDKEYLELFNKMMKDKDNNNNV